MILYYDARATEYRAAYHPERPARLLGTEKLLRELHTDWEWRAPRVASDDEILRAHSPEHLARLLMAFDFDTDTPAYPGIAAHARRAAGAALEVVDRALDRKKSFKIGRAS